MRKIIKEKNPFKFGIKFGAGLFLGILIMKLLLLVILGCIGMIVLLTIINPILTTLIICIMFVYFLIMFKWVKRK